MRIETGAVGARNEDGTLTLACFPRPRQDGSALSGVPFHDPHVSSGSVFFTRQGPQPPRRASLRRLLFAAPLPHTSLPPAACLSLLFITLCTQRNLKRRDVEAALIPPISHLLGGLWWERRRGGWQGICSAELEDGEDAHRNNMLRQSLLA